MSCRPRRRAAVSVVAMLRSFFPGEIINLASGGAATPNCVHLRDSVDKCRDRENEKVWTWSACAASDRGYSADCFLDVEWKGFLGAKNGAGNFLR